MSPPEADTAPAPASDTALLERVASRDRSALRSIRRRHYAAVRDLAYGLLLDAETADAIVAAVFGELWATAHRVLELRIALPSWLMNQVIIAVGAVLTERRRRTSAGAGSGAGPVPSAA